MQFKDPTETPKEAKRYYLAGKMSGLPQFNIPHFYRVAAKLRQDGWKIINPAEEDSEILRDLGLRSLDGHLNDIVSHTSWGEVLGRDVTLVADKVDGIILMEGWEDSRGARLEAFVATLTDKEILFYVEGTSGEFTVTDLDPNLVRNGILG